MARASARPIPYPPVSRERDASARPDGPAPRCGARERERRAVEHEVAHLQHGGNERGAAAGAGAHAGEELSHHKGLCQVVIGAHVESGDAVGGLALGGEQKDGDGLAAAAELAHHLKAAHPGHHDVEDEAVVAARERIVEGRAAVEHGVDGVVLVLEDGGEHLDHIGFVVGNQDAHGVSSLGRAFPRWGAGCAEECGGRHR